MGQRPLIKNKCLASAGRFFPCALATRLPPGSTCTLPGTAESPPLQGIWLHKAVDTYPSLNPRLATGAEVWVARALLGAANASGGLVCGRVGPCWVARSRYGSMTSRVRKLSTRPWIIYELLTLAVPAGYHQGGFEG